jgi:hypothetical protein
MFVTEQKIKLQISEIRKERTKSRPAVGGWGGVYKM